MNYNLKIVIDNTELLESEDLTVKTPFISGVSLKMSTALTPMGIGATASDALYFTLYNPFKSSFDGAKVDFYISPQGDTSTDSLGEIEREVGDAVAYEAIDISDTVALENDTEEGEELTPEEMAETEEAETETINAVYNFYNGEDAEIVDVTTSEETESAWRKVGTYYVFSQTNSTNDNAIRFECLDGFSMLGETFTPTVKNTTIQNIYNDYKAQALERYGVVVDAYEFDDDENITVNWNLDVSFRASIGYMAGMLGGFAAFDSDNVLGISFYSYNDTILLTDRVIAFDETSAGVFEFDGVTCDRSINPYRDDIIETGAGQAINFANPFVNETLLDKIYDLYKGVKYTGANLTIVWDDNILAGQFIRIMTPDEYANYIKLANAYAEATDADTRLQLREGLGVLGKTVLVSNQTVDFKGDATSTITSICDSEYKTANKITSPNDGVFRNLYAEMIAAEYIDATKVVTEGLQAETAEIKQAVVDNIDVNSINGNVIKNSAILAKALSNEVVETITGAKVYYQPTEPTGGTYHDGDIWYKTLTDEVERPYTDTLYVYTNGAWTLQDFDTTNGILRANLITAQEIAANTITANNINMDNLQANIARIGNTSRRYVEITDNSVNIIENGNTLASFGETTVLGRHNEIKLDSGIVELNSTSAQLYLPNYHTIRVKTDGVYRALHGLVMCEGVTSNGWHWQIKTSNWVPTLEAWAIDSYTPTGTNTAFGSTGLYYRDTTKSLATVFEAAEATRSIHGFDFENCARNDGLELQATTNGNTGSGYITVWKASYDGQAQTINTRFVSNVSTNMGTVKTSYRITINGNSGGTYDGE